MARFNTDVYATSNVKPSCFSSRPAARASSMPFSLRSTSVHPVNRFSLFHALSPCLSNTTRFMFVSFEVYGVRCTVYGLVALGLSHGTPSTVNPSAVFSSSGVAHA